MSQPGPSQPRIDSDPYSLEVIRVDGIHKRSRKSRLSVEVSVNNNSKTIAIDHHGKPTSDATLSFSQSGSSSVIDVSLAQSGADIDERLLGYADIKDDVLSLLRKSIPYEFKRDLTQSFQSSDTKKRIVTTGTIRLCLDLTDPWQRAKVSVNMAEQRLEDMKMMPDKVASTDSTISTVIKAVDRVKDIVDTVAEIHPLINLSWKVVLVIYGVITYQFRTDAMLVDMATKMKDAFRLSAEARSLDDRTKTLLRSKIKSLLNEIAQCSRFLQEYANCSPAVRLLRQTDRDKIDGFKDRCDDLRKDLDSIIAVNTGKGVDAIECRQLLETLVDPAKMDISQISISTRARCLKGTRESYVNEIMSVLLRETGENVAASSAEKRFVWLTGAAGVGKSTIALTIADAFDAKCSPAACLFSERGKDEYMSAVRAIAYRVAMCHPSVRPYIANAVKSCANISGSPLQTQFQRLVLEPIRAAADTVQRPITVILDALDECGTIPQRKELLSLLVDDFARLPSQVRILITSRPDSDITNRLQFREHIHHIDVKHTSQRDRQDIDRYIQETIVATVEQGPPKGLEWSDVCKVLSEAADGLFIWAATATKVIGDSSNKRRKLRTLLEDIESVGGGIDSLYATVLQQSGISWGEAETRNEFVKILGVILFAKEVLSGEDIEAFFDFEEDAVDIILKPLRSIILYEPGKPVRLRHASFGDYLTSDRSDGEQWHIEETTQRQLIAERCFATMKTKLHFNMCDLESSFVRNNDVCDLADRAKFQIPPYLKYACLHWAQHLRDVSYSPELFGMLSDFANERLLFWFEVLSLTGSFGRVATDALTVASDWSKDDTGIASFLKDARKLASMFAFPIINSTPHIYVSMIPLSEGDSEVAAHYSKRMSCMTRVGRIGVKRPPLCLKLLGGHSDAVRSVAFAPNGKHLASAAEDNIAKVWDVDSGEEIFALKGCAVCFSPGGDRIATGAVDGALSVWDAENGQLVFSPLGGHARWVTSVVWSPDGARIASGSTDSQVIVWDSDGKVIFTLEGHSKEVYSVAFSADSTRLASGSHDNTIRIWDVKSGKLAFGPFDAESDVDCVAFSPSGAHLVSGASFDVIKIWEVESGNLISTWEDGMPPVAYLPCGTRIVSRSWEKTVKVWDVESRSIVCSLEGHTDSVTSVSISRDGKYIASGSWDTTVRIWDTIATTSVSQASTKHLSGVTSVAISPDGCRIASASHMSIIVWDAETGNFALGPLPGHTKELPGHTKEVTCVAFTPDGSRLLSGSYDKTVRIWDAETGESVTDLGPLEHGGRVECVAVSPDGKTVASGSDDGTISVWSIASGQLVADPLRVHLDSVISVAFSPDGKQLASGSNDETIIVWNTHNWEAASRLTRCSDCVDCVCFSPDGTRIASGLNNDIVIWDSGDGHKVAGPFRGHTSVVESVVYSLDGRHIISGSGDRTIRVWSVESGTTDCILEGHSDWVRSIAISSDGRRLVSGSDDNTIRVWDVSDVLRPAAEIVDRGYTFPSGWVLRRDDGWIVGGPNQRDLLLWIPPDLRNSLLLPHNTAVMGCNFSTKFDFTDAAIGTRWSECFDRQPDSAA